MKTEQLSVQEIADPDGFDPDGLELDVYLHQLCVELYRTTLADLGSDITVLHSYQLQSERCGCYRCKGMFATALESYTQKWNQLISNSSSEELVVS